MNNQPKTIDEQIQQLENSIYLNEQCNNTYAISGAMDLDYRELQKLRRLKAEQEQ